MHELGLAQQTLELALHIASQQGAHRVVAFKLRIGDWSGVVVEAMVFALSTLLQGTIAEGAAIQWETVKPAVRCAQCGVVYEVESYQYTCAACGQENYQLCRGQEIELLTIEVDECVTIADAKQ